MGYKYKDEKGEHLHLFDDQPLYGTSSVMKVLNKPLAYWASGLAVQCFGVPDSKVLTKIKNKKATPEEKEELMNSLAQNLDEIKNMTVEEYFVLCDQAYRAHATSLKDSQVEGTDLHAELESYVKAVMADDDGKVFDEKIYPFIEWSKKNVKRFIASEIHCFSTKYWVGGISDVVAELNDGRIVVIDFKSAKEAYLSHKWQACGYALQFEENGGYTAGGKQVLDPIKVDAVIIFPFGAKELKANFYEDMEGGKTAFLACLTLTKMMPSDYK